MSKAINKPFVNPSKSFFEIPVEQLFDYILGGFKK